jgi:hypothetical protein
MGVLAKFVNNWRLIWKPEACSGFKYKTGCVDGISCILNYIARNGLSAGSSFYDAFSVTRIFSVDDRVKTEW